MKIVIIGLGTIGRTILKNLSGEGHTITIIDEDKELVETLIETYDVFGVIGNGACMDIQREANAQGTDLAIALTRNDELNIFACLVAKRLGVKNTVARVRNPAYRKQIAQMRADLGISMVVNPERETAKEIFHLIDLPAAARMEYFAEGRVLLVEVAVEKGCRLIGKRLSDIGNQMKAKVLICAVQRRGTVTIPSGQFAIEEGDRIYFTADAKKLGDFLVEANLFRSPLRKILIVGGGRTGYYLAELLSGQKYRVKLIEKDGARAEALAEMLPRVTVVCGNGTQHELLLEEGLEAMDAFVALTETDEENVMMSLFANKKKKMKSITRIRREDLFEMLEELGIKNKVSPRDIAASRILSYVRALANTRGSNVLTLYRMVDHQVEALEFIAKKPEPIYDIPLKDLKIKDNCLIACLIRNQEVIIPDGNAVIRLGDKVIVVTTHKNFNDLSDAFHSTVRNPK